MDAMVTPIPRRTGHRPMSRPQLQALCRGLRGTFETLHGEPYNFLVYTIGGVKFAYFKTSEPERWRFSVRVAPDRFVELTDVPGIDPIFAARLPRKVPLSDTDVPGVKPARWRGRYHWITIVKVRHFPADYLGELVEWSYRKALHSLPRRRQTALTGVA